MAGRASNVACLTLNHIHVAGFVRNRKTFTNEDRVPVDGASEPLFCGWLSGQVVHTGDQREVSNIHRELTERLAQESIQRIIISLLMSAKMTAYTIH